MLETRTDSANEEYTHRFPNGHRPLQKQPMEFPNRFPAPSVLRGLQRRQRHIPLLGRRDQSDDSIHPVGLWGVAPSEAASELKGKETVAEQERQITGRIRFN